MQLNVNSENINIQHELVKTNHVIWPRFCLQLGKKSYRCRRVYHVSWLQFRFLDKGITNIHFSVQTT